MKIFRIQQLIDTVRNYIDSISRVKIKLYYIGKAKHHNAGDMFNINIMRYLGLEFKKVRATNANTYCIGSILNSIVVQPKLNNQKNKICNILGAGFSNIPEQSEILAKNIKVYALRGKLSKEILENLTQKNIDCILADPGLLVSYLYPYYTTTKLHKVGIIPHFEDKNDILLKNIQLNKYNYKIIDIEDDIETIAKDINCSECILSSSLHGLIFSDSFGIPNRQISLSKKKNNFKYKDYYSSFNQNLPRIIDLQQEIITDETIDEILNSYTCKKEKVKEKQNELLETFEKFLIDISH